MMATLRFEIINKYSYEVGKIVAFIHKHDGISHYYYLNDKSFRNKLEAGEVFILICIDEKPIGFSSLVSLSRDNDENRFGQIRFIEILKEYSRRLYGTLLANYTLSLAKSVGINYVINFVEKDSPKCAYLEYLGYTRLNDLNYYYFTNDKYYPASSYVYDLKNLVSIYTPEHKEFRLSELKLHTDSDVKYIINGSRAFIASGSLEKLPERIFERVNCVLKITKEKDQINILEMASRPYVKG